MVAITGEDVCSDGLPQQRMDRVYHCPKSLAWPAYIIAVQVESGRCTHVAVMLGK